MRRFWYLVHSWAERDSSVAGAGGEKTSWCQDGYRGEFDLFSTDLGNWIVDKPSGGSSWGGHFNLPPCRKYADFQIRGIRVIEATCSMQLDVRGICISTDTQWHSESGKTRL